MSGAVRVKGFASDVRRRVRRTAGCVVIEGDASLALRHLA